jgi:hypothetical protein
MVMSHICAVAASESQAGAAKSPRIDISQILANCRCDQASGRAKSAGNQFIVTEPETALDQDDLTKIGCAVNAPARA